MRFRVAELLRAPDEPVTVTVETPTTAELLDDSVNRIVPPVFGGPKDAVTPFGNPDAARATAPLNPS